MGVLFPFSNRERLNSLLTQDHASFEWPNLKFISGFIILKFLFFLLNRKTAPCYKNKNGGM